MMWHQCEKCYVTNYHCQIQYDKWNMTIVVWGFQCDKCNATNAIW